MMKKEGRGGRKKPESFEDALKRLEEIVQRMESGDLALEDSLGLFEEGVRLTRVCSQRLDEAEKKIELLTRDEKGGVKAESVDPDLFEQKISHAEGEGEAG
jgi:exodeoxyribonuclease VII small subunit